MYNLTTDTGLNISTDTAVALEEALRAELAVHSTTRAVGYTITLDGQPQYYGWIDVHHTAHDSSGFLADSVREAIDHLIVSAARTPQDTSPASASPRLDLTR